MEIFEQGYRLQYTDLNTWFYTNTYVNAAPLDNIGTTLDLFPGAPLPYSPFWVRYGIGYVDGIGHYHEFGERYRMPVELQTGLFHPNFIIGSDWGTGIYEIRWKYRISDGDDIQVMKVQFYVESAGTYDRPGTYTDCLDLTGAMIVV